MTKPKNPEYEACKKFIFLALKDIKGINWGNEVRMAKRLLLKFPFLKDWKAVNLAEKPATLSFYLSKDGKEFINKEQLKKNIVLAPKKEVVLQGDVLGENVVSKVNKPKTVLDFLRE